MLNEDDIKDIITDLLIIDDVKIGFYKKADNWNIHRIWENKNFYGIEIRYTESGEYYTTTQLFNKIRVNSILRDRKINKILNGI
jgi:hypothetical protein